MPQEYFINKGYKLKGIKKCKNCGCEIEIYLKRDLTRKQFCSRTCHSLFYLGTKGMKWNETVRQKMRESKLKLLKTGWKPTGWLKYIPKTRISGRGYKMIGSKREHQVIIEKIIGRKLQKGEIIHHKNLNKSDNRISNLQLMNRSEHMKLHNKLRKCQYNLQTV